MNYELKAKAKRHKRILAFDPGTRNMGLSCVELRGDRPVVLANVTMESPLHDIPSFMQQRDSFIKEVKYWIKVFDPDAIVAERFQSRGLMGSTVECVSMMLGMLGMLGLPVLFITASTWKNKYQKRFDCSLRDIYKEIHTTPHQLDSSLIGCYALEVGTSKLYDFNLGYIIDAVYDTTLNGVKK